MSEPTPPAGDDVPDRVLDELKLVFGGPDEPVTPDTVETEVVPPRPVAPVPITPQPTAPTTMVGPTTTVAQTVADEADRQRATIVIGGDDSLPDAVYLDDGDLEALTRSVDDDSGGRNTIVIGNELDSTGAFDAVAVPSRSMDPRVRARRVAVKRARGRKRLLWAGVIALVLLCGVAVLAVFSSSLFAVDHVDVQGASYTRMTDGARLQAVIDEMQGEPVLLVDTLAAERELESIPWIERAFVTTDFPDRVIIDIRERLPLATFQGSDSRYRVIDRDGRVLSVLDGRPTDYMLLTGPAPDTEAGDLAGAPFADAAQLISALPPEIRSLAWTASVDATTGDLGLMMWPPAPVAAGDPTDTTATTSAATSTASLDEDDLIEVRIGSPAGLDGKLARLLQLIHDGVDGVERIDVSTNEVSVTKG